MGGGVWWWWWGDGWRRGKVYYSILRTILYVSFPLYTYCARRVRSLQARCILIILYRRSTTYMWWWERRKSEKNVTDVGIAPACLISGNRCSPLEIVGRNGCKMYANNIIISTRNKNKRSTSLSGEKKNVAIYRVNVHIDVKHKIFNALRRSVKSGQK